MRFNNMICTNRVLEFALKYVSVSVILCGLAAEGNLEKIKEVCEDGDHDVNASGRNNN